MSRIRSEKMEFVMAALLASWWLPIEQTKQYLIFRCFSDVRIKSRILLGKTERLLLTHPGYEPERFSKADVKACAELGKWFLEYDENFGWLHEMEHEPSWPVVADWLERLRWKEDSRGAELVEEFRAWFDEVEAQYTFAHNNGSLCDYIDHFPRYLLGFLRCNTEHAYFFKELEFLKAKHQEDAELERRAQLVEERFLPWVREQYPDITNEDEIAELLAKKGAEEGYFPEAQRIESALSAMQGVSDALRDVKAIDIGNRRRSGKSSRKPLKPLVPLPNPLFEEVAKEVHQRAIDKKKKS